MLKKTSLFLIIIGIIFIAKSSFMTITGNVINENLKIGGSVAGLIFVISGLALLLSEFQHDPLKIENYIDALRNIGYKIKETPTSYIINHCADTGLDKIRKDAPIEKSIDRMFEILIKDGKKSKELSRKH